MTTTPPLSNIQSSAAQCPFLNAPLSNDSNPLPADNSPSRQSKHRSLLSAVNQKLESILSFTRRRIFKPSKGVGYRHVILYYILSMLTITMLVFNSANTVFLLNVYLKTPKDNQGALSGDLGFAQEIMILATSFLWGLASDFTGRALVFACGFWLMSLGLILSSWMYEFTWLLVVRLIFAAGAAACTAMMTAVLGDYIAKGDRGKGGGMLGFVSGLGAVIAALAFLRFPSWLASLVNTNDEEWVGHVVYAGIGTLYAVLGLAAIVGLKSPNRRSILKTLMFWRRQSSEEPLEQERSFSEGAFEDQSSQDEANKEYAPLVGSDDLLGDPLHKRISNQLVVILKHAWKAVAATRHPPIFLSYFASFVARADSAIITTFLTLWVAQQMRIEHPGITDSAATARGGLVSGIAQTAALVTAPVWGILADKLNYSSTLVLASIVSGVGYVSMGFLSSVTHGWVFLPVCLIGMGEIGVIIVSQGLVARFVPEDILGTVSGVFTLFGGMGILVTTKLGGWMFDNWSPASLFVFYGISNLLLAIIAVIVCLGYIGEVVLRKVKKHKSEQESDAKVLASVREEEYDAQSLEEKCRV